MDASCTRWTPCATSVASPGSTISCATWRYGLRVLNRQRMFAAVAVLTLAIGIGATAAVFSVVKGVLLRPLAYPRPDELGGRHSAPGAPGIADVSGELRLSPSMYFTYAETEPDFSELGVWSRARPVTGPAEPERVRAPRRPTARSLPGRHARPRAWLSRAEQSPAGRKG